MEELKERQYFEKPVMRKPFQVNKIVESKEKETNCIESKEPDHTIKLDATLNPDNTKELTNLEPLKEAEIPAVKFYQYDNVISHYFNMGMKSVIDIKIKEQGMHQALDVYLFEARDKLNKLEESKKHMVETVGLQKENVLVMEKCKQQLDKDRSKTKMFMEALKKRYNELDNLYETLESKRKLFNTNIVDQNIPAVNYEFEKKFNFEMEKLKSIRKSMTEEIRSLDKILNTFTKEDEMLKTQCNTYTTKIAFDKDEINKKSQLCKQIEKTLQDNLKTCEILLHKIQAMADTNNLQERKEHLIISYSQKNTEKKKQMDDFNSKLNAAEQEKSAVATNISMIMDNVNDLNIKLTSCKAENKSLKIQVEDFKFTFENSLKDIDKEISLAESEHSKLSECFKNIECKLSTLLGQKAEINEKFAREKYKWQKLIDASKLKKILCDHELEKHNNYNIEINKSSDHLSNLNLESKALEEELSKVKILFDHKIDTFNNSYKALKLNVVQEQEILFKVKGESAQKLKDFENERLKYDHELSQNKKEKAEQNSDRMNEFYTKIEKLKHDILSLKSENESLISRVNLKNDYIDKQNKQHQKLLKTTKNSSQDNAAFEKQVKNDAKLSGILKSPGSKKAPKKVTFQSEDAGNDGKKKNYSPIIEDASKSTENKMNVFKSPILRKPNVGISVQQSLLNWESDSADESLNKGPTSDELFAELLRDSSPERLVPQKK